MDQVFVVFKCQSGFDTYDETPVRAFLTRAAAEIFVSLEQDYVREQFERLEQIHKRFEIWEKQNPHPEFNYDDFNVNKQQRTDWKNARTQEWGRLSLEVNYDLGLEYREEIDFKIIELPLDPT